MSVNEHRTLKNVSIMKMGDHGKNKRIWITNKKLQDVFPKGAQVIVTYNEKDREITVEESFFGATNTISGRANGTPILDLKGSAVGETLGDVKSIDVLFFSTKIIIRVSKTEIAKEERRNKTGFNVFELFVGGSTLNTFIKEAGKHLRVPMQIIGGLDMSEDYITSFVKNNDGTDIYTITGDIADVDLSFYPKDVDILLCGIPCTTFSNANLILRKALKNKREGKEYDKEVVQRALTGDALTYYVIEAVRYMNVRTCVFEEVEAYTKTSSYELLVSILTHMGYTLSEKIATGKNTKRKRWTMVATMGSEISLEGLNEEDNGKTIEDCLEVKSDKREWKPKSEFAPSRLNEKIGIRKHYTNEKKINTVSCHYTRGTEPILSKDFGEETYYSELSNREIANLHGLPKSFILDDRKKYTREILGQGVTEMFFDVGVRVIQSHLSA